MLYLFVFHLIDDKLVLNPFVVFGQIFLSLIAMVWAVRAERNASGDKISKQDALKHSFLAFVVSQMLFWLFVYAMFNFINPELTEIQRKMMLEAGMKVENQDLTMTLGMIFKRWAFMLIPGFFLSLMVASFMKK